MHTPDPPVTDTCASATTCRLPAGETRVGPYRLLRPVGEGGMGTVWLAERADGLYERRVALKLPRGGPLSDWVDHLRREREIAARLEHPNIARLYDAGVDDTGRPYLAMEFVEGEPIDAWCRRTGAGAHEVLALFAPVAHAVAHAHAQGVVHRDLKPANILVDAAGRPRLLDFGIAARLQHPAPPSDATRALRYLMTPRYASPEQIAGEPARTTSDVYSLGVTLHELLTGQPPAGDTGTPAALHGDVAAVVGRALAYEPAQRYPDAGALAADLDRLLAGQHVQAPRRRRLPRPALAVSLLVVLAMAAGAWLGRARPAFDTPQGREVGDFVVELLRHPVAAGGATPAALERLIETRFADRHDLQAALFDAAGRVYQDLGAGRAAITFAQRRLALLEAARAPAAARGRALLQLAHAHRVQGRHAEALVHARAALARFPDARSDDGLDARAVLAGLLLPAGGHAEARTLIAEAALARPFDRSPPSEALARMLDTQGRLLEIDNRYDDALALWRRAIDTAVRAVGPDAPLANQVRLRIAVEALGRNRVADARLALDETVASLSRSGEAGQVQAALARSRFAELGFSMGHLSYPEAAAMLADAHAAVARWGDALPPQVLASVDVRRGVVALRRGDLVGADTLLRQALPVAAEATDGLIDSRLLASHAGLLARARGDHGEAAVQLQRRLDLRVQAGNGRAPQAATDWEQLAHNEVMRGDLVAAEALLARAPAFGALSGDVVGRGELYARAVAEQRARVRLAAGDAQAALAMLPSDDGLPPAEDRSDPTLAPYALRGEVLCAAGRPAEGLPRVEASIAAIAPDQFPASPILARLRAVAGNCRLALGDRAGAARYAAQAQAAFAAKPQVSGWYHQPLATLERGLAAR